MAEQITKDSAYNTVAPTDFKSLMEVERYGDRSSAFDKIISATHDHFWDPLDKKYIDSEDDFDLDTQMILPEDMVPSLQLDYVQQNLKEEDRIRFANDIVASKEPCLFLQACATSCGILARKNMRLIKPVKKPAT